TSSRAAQAPRQSRSPLSCRARTAAGVAVHGPSAVRARPLVPLAQASPINGRVPPRRLIAEGASGILDWSDLHDGVGPDEDLSRLQEHGVVVAADHVEARDLLDTLREWPLGEQHVARRPALDRPCLAAVGESGAASHLTSARLELRGEL